MIINYLAWYNDLEVRLQSNPTAHLLMSSSVVEPTDILTDHLGSFSKQDLASVLSVSDAWGYPGLAESIARRYGIPPENVTATNGVSNAIYLICRLLLTSDDHVVVESPVYEPLVASPDFIDCRISLLRRRPPDYLIDPNGIKDIVKRDTKMILVSNLHNPSGALLPDDSLMALAREAVKINPEIRVVVDEVYRDFVSSSVLPAATLDDCFISLSSLTKAYGLGALHTGWVVADPELIGRMKLLQKLVEGSGAKLLEAFASLIIDSLQVYWDHSAGLVSENRALLRKHLQPLVDDRFISGVIPEHGCIYFPQVRGVESTDELVEGLAEEHSVYVVPGRFFGEPSHMRIGFGGRTERLDESLGALVSGLKSLLVRPSS